LVFIVVAYKPALMLFLFSSLYIFSGPAQSLYRLFRKQAKKTRHLIHSSPDRSEKGVEGKS
jgi:hypothetical protein